MSEMNYMITNGLAVPSTSSWSSPCVLVRKTDGTFHPCTGFRKLNAVTKPDSVPLPRLEEIDASDAGAGSVLLYDDQKGAERPVVYFSKKLKGYQRSYSVTEKEALALVLALRHFDIYVGSGRSLIVYTDHNPLTFLHSLQNPNQRLMQWALFLQLYHLDIHHNYTSSTEFSGITWWRVPCRCCFFCCVPDFLLSAHSCSRVQNSERCFCWIRSCWVLVWKYG